MLICLARQPSPAFANGQWGSCESSRLLLTQRCFSSWGYTPAEAGRTASAAGNKQGEGRSDGRVLEATFSVVALLPSGPDETRIAISAHQCLILRNAPRKMNPFWGNR